VSAAEERKPVMEDIIRRFEPLWDVWQVDKFLGQGSFGRVWQVKTVRGGTTAYAAVKEVRIPFSTGDLYTARAEGLDPDGAKAYFEALMKETQREVDLMRDLACCENVVQLYDCQTVPLDEPGEFGWVILLRMERLVPFKSILCERNLTVQEIARLGIDIARALEACEAHGIIHRDIKPDNLFYQPENGRYKLGDFGIAHYLERPTEGKGRAGTLTHMPPEVYQGAPFTPAADLYALGMVLYRLLNDNRIPLLPPYPTPFTPKERDRATVQRLRGAVVGEPAIVRYAACAQARGAGIGAQFDAESRGLADALGRIACRALAVDPRDRFPSAAALREAIEQI